MGVPALPGVPALSPDLIVSVEAALLSPDSILSEISSILDNGSTNWGVYDDDNDPIAVFDTFLGIAYKDTSRVSTYPIEQGGFATYNKVQLPFRGYVQLACGFDVATRTALLESLDYAKKSLQLYSVVTPDATYLSASIEDYSYERRRSEGAYLLVVTLSIIEVRLVNAQYTTTTKQPASTPVVNDGKVQGTSPADEPKDSILYSIGKSSDSIAQFVKGLF